MVCIYKTKMMHKKTKHLHKESKSIHEETKTINAKKDKKGLDTKKMHREN